jgi:predicted transcriptional regulator
MIENEIIESKLPADALEAIELHEKLLSVLEVANILRVSRATLCNFRRKKNGPLYVKIGREFKYPEKKLYEFINKQVNL